MERLIKAIVNVNSKIEKCVEGLDPMPKLPRNVQDVIRLQQQADLPANIKQEIWIGPKGGNTGKLENGSPVLTTGFINCVLIVGVSEDSESAFLIHKDTQLHQDQGAYVSGSPRNGLVDRDGNITDLFIQQYIDRKSRYLSVLQRNELDYSNIKRDVQVTFDSQIESLLSIISQKENITIPENEIKWLIDIFSIKNGSYKIHIDWFFLV